MADQVARPRELWALGPREVGKRWRDAGLTLSLARDAYPSTPLGRLTFRGPGNVLLDLSPAVSPKKQRKLTATHVLALMVSHARRDLEGEVYVRVGEKAHPGPAPYPAFAAGCYQDHPHMLLPDFYSADVTRIDALRAQLHERIPWEDKLPHGLARFGSVGYHHGHLRVDLCGLSGPELDAKVVRRRDKRRKGDCIVPDGCWGDWISPDRQARHRYLVDIDSWEGRFWKPYSGSLLIEVQNPSIPWVTWRSMRMEPGVHYLAASSPQGVVEQIRWAMLNNKQAECIAINGCTLAVQYTTTYTLAYAAEAFSAYLELFS